MDRKHRLGFSWLAIVLCMALLMTGMPFAPAYAKSKKKESAKETTFTIKWKVNGETIKKDKVKKGEKPEKPADPADYTDGKYTYTFSGWDPKVTKATQDMTYQAKFKKSERTFRITWLDDKGKKIDVTEVKYGKVPDHEAPKKEVSEKYTYTFDGWDPKPVKAKADATYTATFKKEARRYVITWLDDKGNVIDQTKVAYGKLPAHDDPVKKSGKATYTFTGWKPELTKVTGDATYTATFRKEEKYTITWLDDAGNVIDTTQVERGQKPTHDDPVKEATQQYTYTFAGWTPKVVRAQADATYTATFKEKTRKYTITWLDADGNEIDRTQVAYGKKPTHADPTREETESFTYVFKGWEPKPERVTGDATYRAVFEEVPKKVEPTEAPGDYTITWLDDAGNVIDTTRVSKGQKPTHDDPVKEPTEQYTYKFAGWTPKVVRAQADATYTATFKEKLRKYTITWQDDAGNVIDETRVAYGKTPKHDDPVKAPSENATYTFAGWTPELAPVTGDATYTATFTQTLNGETDPGVEDPSMAAGNSVEILFKYLGDTPDKDTLIDYPQKVVETDEPQQVYYSGTEPVKAEDDDFAYEWIGWTDDRDNPTVAKYGKSTNKKETPLLPVVTVDTPAETVYYAVFRAIPLHTITWNDDDGTLIDTTRVAEGRRPVHEDPNRKGYKFDGWLDENKTLHAAGEELPEVTGDAAYTAQYTVHQVLYDITWVIDGEAEITQFEAGERPTHEKPVSAIPGYEFAGWEDAKGKLHQADKLPVVTAAAIYTAQWELALTLPDVNCYALLKSKADRKTAKETLLPTEVTLEDGTVVEGLDWSDAELDGYVPSSNGVKNDGKYTYTLLHPQEDDENRILKLTCTLIVGPKQSKTAGKGKNKKANEDYTYRWDSIVADAAKAKAIITGWKGDDKVLVIPSVIDGMAVTAIGNGVFQNKKKVTSITVPAGVTDIGKGAFANCEKLTTLTLPDSLTSIGMELTDGSDALTTLNLSVVLETTLAMDQDGYYTIRHVADKTDPENPVMSQTVTLPEGFPTDIAIAAPGELTLADDFVVTEGHQVADASLVTEDGGTLKAEITWLDDDETEIDRTEVAYGEIPTHKDPKDKTGTDGITYAFKGWTPTPVEVTGPATYTAEYGEKKYTVTFVNYDGETVLETAEFRYSAIPKYRGEGTPTREADERYTYTFEGWVDAADKKEEPTVYIEGENDLPPVTADVTYKAHYISADRLYTLTFVNEDGTTVLLKKEGYKYEDQPIYDGETPAKAADEQHFYAFEGWVDVNDASKKPTVYASDKLPKVTADATYKASFKEGTPVELVTTYNGKKLTKVYDCNNYGAYVNKEDGQVVYVIEDLKTIKSQFKLALSGKKAKWVEDHKNVDFKLVLTKQYDSADVGSYEFEFRVTLTGDDAMYYKMKEEMVKVPASITPREVVITPRAGLYKTYGTTDPKYPEGSWLSNDETSPLHQDLSGVAGYGVPVNTVDGKLSLTITNAAYLLQEANLKGTKFFPGDNPWLVRQEGEDVGKYKILIGGMNFGSNFTMKLKDEVFTINAKNIGDANVTVDAIAAQQYTGKAITLDKDKLVVRYGTMTLEEGKDFTTEYKNNTEASTDTKKATVTLTGKGNYTGTREVTFSIIKTVTPTATPKTSGGGGYSGGSSSYDFGYDDFDDDPEGDTAGEEEGADAQSNANWTPVPDGNIKLNEMDYGTVLFGADGKPRPFSQLEEDYEGDIADSGDSQTEFEDIDDAEDGAVEVEDTDEEAPMLHRVVIRADSMKRRVETSELTEAEEGAGDQVEEDVLLEGTDRKRYEELHLRLTDSIVQGLINNGISEIVYELEQTRLRIPLSALRSVITLPNDTEDEESPDDGFDVEDELEIEDGGEAEEDGEIVVDDADVSVNSPSGARTLPVDGYEIVIEQADATGLTPREAQLIADNTTLLPAYRVRVRIIPEDAQQAPTGEVDENGLPITVPVTESLPEGYTLPGVVLLLQTNDSFEMSPEEAQVLYASEELSTAEGGVAFVENVGADVEAVEMTEESAGDEAEQVNSLKENAQAIAEDAGEFEADAEDETEDADGFEADAEDESEEEEDIGEAMVAINRSLADAIDSDKASLTQAIFNEEEIPMVVEIDPVESGLYVVLVPQDWDPTPYLSQEDGEETTTDEADEDEVEFVDESEIDDEELVEF